MFIEADTDQLKYSQRGDWDSRGHHAEPFSREGRELPETQELPLTQGQKS